MHYISSSIVRAIKSALAQIPATGVLALTIMTGATAPVAQAQSFSVIRSLGLNANDPKMPTNPGMMAQGRDGYLYTTSPRGGTHDYGAVYKVSPSGGLTVLYNFDGTHGANPYSGLTLGSDGNFYGTTFAGGTTNVGTIFKITPAGALSVLYNFKNQGDGAGPFAPPIQGIDGNFYGTTNFAGAAGDGVIYKLTSTGRFSVLHSFGYTSGSYSQAPLVQGVDGNFYGTTVSGGNSNNGQGVIFRVSASGAYKVLYGFEGAHGSASYSPLFQGSDGNLYGTTAQGGASAVGEIFKITPAGVITVAHSFSKTGTDGWQPYGGLIQATDGNYYGGTQLGGSGYGVLYRLTGSGAYSTLHSFNGSDGNQVLGTFLQHTSGAIYGETYQGGSTSVYGEVFSLRGGLPAFVRPLFNAGAVGSTVQILGQGFAAGSTTVSFGGKAAASVQVQSSTFLTVTVPSGALSGVLSVKTGSTTLNSNQAFRVLPTIKSFTPAAGPAGTIVVITGSGLTQTTHVSFGGVMATKVTVNSDSQITVDVPSGAKTGAIQITTPGGLVSSSSIYTV